MIANIVGRLFGLVFCVALLGGCCTAPLDYVKNGFKVGPKYVTPPAAVETDWIDAADARIRKSPDDLSQWWKVFNDPVLDDLICTAYKQNLTLRQAGFRVLTARAQWGITIGALLPQTQSISGDANEITRSIAVANAQFIPHRYFNQNDYAFNLAWELDFWGKFRRAVESSRASLDAAAADYDDVFVVLLSDLATDYVQLRVAQQRIRYAQENATLQRRTVEVVENRMKVGAARQLDVDQAKSLLYQTEAGIPELEIGARLSANAICVLLGIPPEDLQAKLGAAPIPVAPVDVGIGIPADLLRRRPDIRRAERQAAAQSALIGVAEADFLPHISLIGTIGYSAQSFNNLFQPKSVVAQGGPAFTWNFLSYGRILNNVKAQTATYNALVAAYQQAVLVAQKEAENGLVTFLKAQKRTERQTLSVNAAQDAVKTVLSQFEAGTVTIAQLILLEQTLVGLQDTLAQAQGEMPLGLIQVYRAVGGGWEIRQMGCELNCAPPAAALLPATPQPPATGQSYLPPAEKSFAHLGRPVSATATKDR